MEREIEICSPPIHEHYDPRTDRAELCGRVVCPFGFVGILIKAKNNHMPKPQEVEKCQHIVHCKCMNLDGRCQETHYNECLKIGDSIEEALEEFEHRFGTNKELISLMSHLHIQDVRSPSEGMGALKDWIRTTLTKRAIAVKADVIVDIMEMRANLINPLERGKYEKIHNMFKYNFLDSLLANLIDKYRLTYEEIETSIKKKK